MVQLAHGLLVGVDQVTTQSLVLTSLALHVRSAAVVLSFDILQVGLIALTQRLPIVSPANTPVPRLALLTRTLRLVAMPRDRRRAIGVRSFFDAALLTDALAHEVRE